MALTGVETAESADEAAMRGAELRELIQGTLARVRGLAVDLRPALT